MRKYISKNVVLKLINTIQKQCNEADGIIDGVTALHTLREEIINLKEK